MVLRGLWVGGRVGGSCAGDFHQTGGWVVGEFVLRGKSVHKPGETRLQFAGCQVLAALATDATNCQRIGEHGGVEHVLRVMEPKAKPARGWGWAHTGGSQRRACGRGRAYGHSCRPEAGAG